jgi:hypothetical protein
MHFIKSYRSLVTANAPERFAPSPHAVSVTQGTDTALLDVISERYYTLNAVGTRIWELLTQGTAVTVIIELLAEEYAAPIHAIQEDTWALLTALQKAGLVKPS